MTKHENWLKCIPGIQFGANNAYRSTTGRSGNEVTHGFKPLVVAALPLLVAALPLLCRSTKSMMA